MYVFLIINICILSIFLHLSFLPDGRGDTRLYFCELSQIPVGPCQVCRVHARHIFLNLVARLPRCTCGTLGLQGGNHPIINHTQWVHVLMGATIAADHFCYFRHGDSPALKKTNPLVWDIKTRVTVARQNHHCCYIYHYVTVH